MNTYGYAFQNPTKFIDRDGRLAFLAAIPFLSGGTATAGGTAAGSGIASAIFTAVGVALAPLAIDILTDVDDVVPSVTTVDDVGDAANDKECPPNDDGDGGCKKQQKSLIATGGVILGLYKSSTTTQDVVAAQKAIQKFNMKVSAHNNRCPGHKVQPLPPILF